MERCGGPCCGSSQIENETNRYDKREQRAGTEAFHPLLSQKTYREYFMNTQRICSL